MSDRIAVFNQGRIEQVGTPAEIYERPGDGVRRRLRRHVEPADRRGRAARCSARTARASIRPEKIRHRRRRARTTTARDGTLTELVYAGAVTRCTSSSSTRGSVMVAMRQNRRRPSDRTQLRPETGCASRGRGSTSVPRYDGAGLTGQPVQRRRGWRHGQS